MSCRQVQTAVPQVGSETQAAPIAATATALATNTPSVSAETRDVTPEATVTANPAPIPVVSQAIDDLAKRLSVSPSAIEVVRAVEVDWPDGSLGCPQPDMRYTQALVNGTFIELRVKDQLYRYHSGGGRTPFLCISKDEVLPEDLPPELRGDPDV